MKTSVFAEPRKYNSSPSPLPKKEYLSISIYIALSEITKLHFSQKFSIEVADSQFCGFNKTANIIAFISLNTK